MDTLQSPPNSREASYATLHCFDGRNVEQLHHSWTSAASHARLFCREISPEFRDARHAENRVKFPTGIFGGAHKLGAG